MSNAWTCPYCNRDCTITDHDICRFSNVNDFGKNEGLGFKPNRYKGEIVVITCPNSKCHQQTITAELHRQDNDHSFFVKIREWKLDPESEAKTFPEYIPEQIREDYTEACLIKNKSPKASATLSRRCLQGIIRDFWSVSNKPNLYQEIDTIREKVDPNTWNAIDAIRKIGNIGAHMEKDVNLIINVTKEEASSLIWLIETLLNDWYIIRHERQEKLREITSIGEEKTAKKLKS